MDLRKIAASITRNKCPNCLRGDYYVSRNPFNLKKLNITHRACSHCGMDFRQEPGFYFGAAYVSYFFQIGILLTLYIILQVLTEIYFWYFVGILFLTLLLLAPVLVRLSRLIWINLFGRKN